MKTYIFTMPKAGTYFAAGLLELLGFENSGLHVLNRKRVQDTHLYSVEQNAKYPTTTERSTEVVPELNRLAENTFAFGHVPLPAAPLRLPGFQFLCLCRHPRKTLVSEFVDFRFRRMDTAFSPRDIPDDKEAFAAYLRDHAKACHSGILMQFVRLVWFARLRKTGFDPNRYLFLNFDQLKSSPAAVSRVGRFLARPIDLGEAERMLSGVKSMDTKTKAADITFDRAGIWGTEAESIYRASNARRAVLLARASGLTFPRK